MLDIVSVTVEEICHRFLILLIGCETIREPCGDLTVTLGCGREVTTLGQDLDFVGVGSGFVHVGSMGHFGVKIKGWWTLPQVSQALLL